jgi:hypothetical protein
MAIETQNSSFLALGYTLTYFVLEADVSSLFSSLTIDMWRGMKFEAGKDLFAKNGLSRLGAIPRNAADLPSRSKGGAE